MPYSNGKLKGNILGDSITQDHREIMTSAPDKMWQWVLERHLRGLGSSIMFESNALAGDVSGAPLTDLTTALTSGATPPFNIIVRDTTSMDKGTITVFIDQEMFTCTVTNGTTLACTARAQLATAAQAHAVGATVRFVQGLQPATNTTLTVRGGDTRIVETPVFGTPDLFGLYLNTNDSNWNFNAVYPANIRALIKAVKYGAYGSPTQQNPVTVAGGVVSTSWRSCRVGVPAGLPAGCNPGDRFVVMVDNATTGGAPDSVRIGAAPRIDGDLSGTPEQTVWECDNPRPGVRGWRRVARNTTIPFDGKNGRPSGGCARLFVMSTHYRNWSSGNPLKDTTSAPNASTTGGGAAPVGLNSDINAKALAAVQAEDNPNNSSTDPWVVFVDLYNYMRQRVIDGIDPDFSGGATYDQSIAGTVLDGNNHFDDFGEWRIAQAVLDPTKGIPTTVFNAWMKDLT